MWHVTPASVGSTSAAADALLVYSSPSEQTCACPIYMARHPSSWPWSSINIAPAARDEHAPNSSSLTSEMASSSSDRYPFVSQLCRTRPRSLLNLPCTTFDCARRGEFRAMMYGRSPPGLFWSMRTVWSSVVIALIVSLRALDKESKSRRRFSSVVFHVLVFQPHRSRETGETCHLFNMLSHLALFLCLIPLSLQYDDNPEGDEICLEACQEAFWNVTFGTTTSTDDYWTGYCQDTDRYESAVLCGKYHCSPRELKAGARYIQHWCTPVHITLPSYETIIANYSDEAIRNMRVYGSVDMVSSDIINGTLLVSDELFARALTTWVRLMLNSIASADLSDSSTPMFPTMIFSFFMGTCRTETIILLHLTNKVIDMHFIGTGRPYFLLEFWIDASQQRYTTDNAEHIAIRKMATRGGSLPKPHSVASIDWSRDISRSQQLLAIATSSLLAGARCQHGLRPSLSSCLLQSISSSVPWITLPMLEISSTRFSLFISILQTSGKLLTILAVLLAHINNFGTTLPAELGVSQLRICPFFGCSLVEMMSFSGWLVGTLRRSTPSIDGRLGLWLSKRLSTPLGIHTSTK